MARILAIDYGLKRVGVAETDPMQLIASPLDTVECGRAVDFIRDYCQKNSVEEIVVGEPRHLSYEPAALEVDILKFIAALKRAVPEVRIVRMDERFTSKIAMRALIEAGVPKAKRARKELLDMTSAALILQSYLEEKKRKI